MPNYRCLYGVSDMSYILKQCDVVIKGSSTNEYVNGEMKCQKQQKKNHCTGKVQLKQISKGDYHSSV